MFDMALRRPDGPVTPSRHPAAAERDKNFIALDCVPGQAICRRG